MIRSAQTGEVLRFRELTTLQAWIVERKVTRDDEISRSGESWKRLGGIAELASFFHVVEQAAAAARTEDPAVAAQAAQAAYSRSDASRDPTRPATVAADQGVVSSPPAQSRHEGPTSMGAIAPSSNEPKVGARRTDFVEPMGFGLSGTPTEDLDDDLELRPARGRGPTLLLLFTALFALGAVGYLLVFQRPTVRRWMQRDRAPSVEYRQGRAYYLLDSDDAFGQASESFTKARTADDGDALAIAGLAEVYSTWAWYLAEDARALEASQPTQAAALAVQTLKKEAQHHLDDARREATNALSLNADLPEANRAMADALRVGGAATSDVQRYLSRALELRPNDPETLYVEAALLYRDGRAADARTRLEQAIQLYLASTQHALLRAYYLQAKVALQLGHREEARQVAGRIIAVNPQHDRARALLGLLDQPVVTPSASPVASAAASPAPSASAALAPSASAQPSPAASTAATVAGGPVAGSSGGGATASGDAGGAGYEKLVSQADKLAENGRATQAQKLYERALQQQPRGVEALMGLAYCHLDAGRLDAAIARFREVLGIAPSYGDALIGLAEASKARGDKVQAAEYYRRYLRDNPNGAKTTMAKNNLRDLEPALAPPIVPQPNNSTPDPGERTLPRPPPEEPPM